MNSPLLSLQDVTFAYTHRPPVLDGLTVSLYPGQRLALTGRNGSGKTTLLRLIVGLLKPLRGTVSAFGKPRVSEADFHEVRMRAGLLFQDPDDQLFCPTVRDDIAFGPLNLGRDRQAALTIVDRVLGMLDMEDYADRVTYTLSGGEKRLVSLAAVLAMEPDVLLLDEPTCGLDESAETRLTEILSGLQQSMLVVCHEARFLEALATDTVVLQDGRIRQATG